MKIYAITLSLFSFCLMILRNPTLLGFFNGGICDSKTNLLPTRLGIFRFLYGERVSEVWENGSDLVRYAHFFLFNNNILRFFVPPFNFLDDV